MRLTTQGVREAANLKAIREALNALGCRVPLSADVHFNPKAAFEAAATADKVRINPGNFVDAARTFRKLEFTDEAKHSATPSYRPSTTRLSRSRHRSKVCSVARHRPFHESPPVLPRPSTLPVSDVILRCIWMN